MNSTRNTRIYNALGGISDFNSIEIVRRPNSITNYPSAENYAVEKYTRYFFKKKNEKFLSETIEEQFDQIDEKLYSKLSVEWYISGNRNYCFKLNSEKIEKIKYTFGNVENIPTPLQFYRS